MSDSNKKTFSVTIGKELNDWLDQESERTAFTKKALVHMAIERLREQREAQKQSKNLENLVEIMEVFKNDENLKGLLNIEKNK